MEALIDKVAFLALPANFAKIFPYCAWYWLMFTLIIIWFFKKK